MVFQEALRKIEIEDSLVTFGGHSRKKMGSKLLYSLAYHPQTYGKNEEVNRSIANLLRSFGGENPSQWDMVLAQANFSYNDSINKSTNKSPF